MSTDDMQLFTAGNTSNRIEAPMKLLKEIWTLQNLSRWVSKFQKWQFQAKKEVFKLKIIVKLQTNSPIGMK